MAFDSTQPFDDLRTDSAVSAGVYRNHLKRGFDILFITLIAIPAILLMVIVAIIIMLNGGSPFYAQQRLGRNGKSFRMWKFRSMVPQADQKLEAYLAANPAARMEWDVSQKLKHDPRITKIGKIIRKTSIDELPQIWNILKGEMSLVGPRPMLCDQRALYPGTAYFSMRPGLSGYWQTSKRNDSSFAERALYDTRYFNDLSFFTDAMVLFRTVAVVLRGTGY